MPSSSGNRRPCPCRLCKPSGDTQIPKTIRSHVLEHGLEPPRRPVCNVSPQPSVKEDANEDPLFPDMSTSDIDFDAQSNGQSRSDAGTPISLEEEYFNMDFTNRSQDSLVRSPTPSGSELDDLSDADEGEGIVIEQDPDFVSRDRLFAEADDLENIEGDLAKIPPAFDEHPVIRNAYIHVFASAAFGSATHAQCQDNLTAQHSTISALEDPHNPIEGLESMARTLPTLERRLGVNPDAHITYFFLCPDCWKRHHPNELTKLESSQCSQEECSGILYTVKRTARRAEKRTPTKIMPYNSPKGAIARLLRRPGMWEQCQLWRKDGDHEPSELLDAEDFFAGDPDAPIDDIYDGFGWRQFPAFLERRWDPQRRRVEDVVVAPGPVRRFVSLPCGLLVAINIDW
jgi:hypothetical protein